MECPLSQSDETGAAAVSKTMWPLWLWFVFCCQACKEANAKNVTLAFGGHSHFWKAVSVPRCASKGLFEHVTGMRSIDAATADINSLEDWKGSKTKRRTLSA